MQEFDTAELNAHAKTICRETNCPLCDEWFKIQPPHYNQRMTETEKKAAIEFMKTCPGENAPFPWTAAHRAGLGNEKRLMDLWHERVLQLRHPGRPPLPPGEKPSEGQPRVEFRIPREVHSWIESQAGPMGVNLWVRKLLENAYENR